MEAALVFIVSFLAIGAVIHISMLLYQQACIKAICDRGVKKGAGVWNHVERDFKTGALEKDKLYSTGLYWQLFDADKNKKLSRIEDFISDEIRKYRIVSARANVHASLEDFILYKNLVVTVECNSRLPFGRWLKIFGLKGEYPLFVQSEAIIHDAADMIRTVDFALDTGKELERKFPDTAGLGKKTKESIGKTLDGIAGFFNFNRND